MRRNKRTKRVRKFRLRMPNGVDVRYEAAGGGESDSESGTLPTIAVVPEPEASTGDGAPTGDVIQIAVVCVWGAATVLSAVGIVFFDTTWGEVQALMTIVTASMLAVVAGRRAVTTLLGKATGA